MTFDLFYIRANEALSLNFLMSKSEEALSNLGKQRAKTEAEFFSVVGFTPPKK